MTRLYAGDGNLKISATDNVTYGFLGVQNRGKIF